MAANSDGSGRDRLRWQGGASLRHDGGRRLGNLYVMDECIWFIEAGRPPDDRFGGAGPMLGVALMAAIIPVAIEGSSRALSSDGFGWAPRLAQIAATLAAIALVVMSVVVAARSRERSKRDLRRMGESEESLEPEMVRTMCDAIAGSFRLPITDIELLERVGDADLRVRTRLDEVYLLRVVPDPVRFLELLDEAGVRPGGQVS